MVQFLSLVLFSFLFSCPFLARADFKIVNTIPPGTNPTDPLLIKGYLDVTKVPYLADNTGVVDSTAVIQQAAIDGRDHQLVVFFPTGTYKVSNTIDMWMEKDPGTTAPKREFPTHIQGSELGARPTIVLADNSPGFEAGTKKPILFFRAQDVDRPATEFLPGVTSAPDNAYHSLRWMKLDVGNGNPGAVGVRMGTSQGGMMEDVVVDATGGFAGVYDSPGMGGGTYNLEVTGGEYGAYITYGKFTYPIPGGKTENVITGSRFLMMAGCKFSGQTKAGIYAIHNQPMVFVGNHFDVPTGAVGIELHQDEGTPAHTNKTAAVNVVDTTFKLKNNHVGIWNPELHPVYMKDVYVSSGAVIVRNATDDWIFGQRSRVTEYAFTDPAMSLNMINGQAGTAEIRSAVVWSLELPSIDAQRALHTWTPGSLPSFQDAGVVNAKDFGVIGDGTADDTAALQAVINANCKVFLPKGVYMTNNVTLPADTHLFGVSRFITSIFGINASMAPNRELISTVDSATGTGSISWMHLLQSKDDPVGYHPLVWRLGRNSIVHAITADDFDSGPLETDTKAFWATGSGGGRWFGLQEDLRQIAGHPGFRAMLIQGTVEPLSIYGWSTERLPDEPMVEISNASNVRFFHFKIESGLSGTPVTFTTPLRITNSTNISLHVMHGSVDLDANKAMVDVIDSTGLWTQVRTLKANVTTDDFNSVKMTTGSTTDLVPASLMCNVCARMP